MSKSARGFTLVELMVTISIIAILTVIGLVVYQQVEMQARVTKVKADLDAMAKQIEIARQVKNATFCAMSGDSNCFNDKDCRSGIEGGATTGKYGDTVQVKDRPDCVNTMTSEWANVTSMPLPKDPWGNVYTFDANEEDHLLHNGVTHDCRWDILSSAGPDGLAWTHDDYYYYVPPFHCKIKEECAPTPGTPVSGKPNNPIDTVACKDPNAP